MRCLPVHFPAAVMLNLLMAAQALPQGGTERAAVADIVEGFADAWNAHDMAAFGRLFAADADFVNVIGDRWTGRAVIQKNHAYTHGTIPASDRQGVTVVPERYAAFRGSTYTFTAIDVRFLRADVAVAHGAWRLEGHAASGPELTTQPRAGMMTFLVAREAGVWQVIAVQNTDRPAR